MDIGTLIPALVGGLIGSLGVWFAFARTLTTRSEVEKMIGERTYDLERNQMRQEDLMESVRAELAALRGEIIRLSVSLEHLRPKD